MIRLETEIVPFEILKDEAKGIIMSAARYHIHKNETFKGRPKVTKYIFRRADVPGMYEARIAMNNQGETAKTAWFEMVFTENQILYSYIRRLEEEIDSVRSSSHTHDYR
jgi:hypothetical protein